MSLICKKMCPDGAITDISATRWCVFVDISTAVYKNKTNFFTKIRLLTKLINMAWDLCIQYRDYQTVEVQIMGIDEHQETWDDYYQER